MNERRRAPRVGVSFPVECNILPQKDYFYTVSKDLSVTGVKIVTNDFLPKNNFIKLNINLIDNVLGLKARVAWCNKERVVDRYSAGLEFVEIDKQNQQYLSSIIR
ncbi:MAG: PilZ domain-containing protein [Candidatus Omnitrophota bacterium]